MSNEVEGNKKQKRGFARIQFLAIEPEAKQLIEAGHTLKSAYEELRDAGSITMSYSMFRKYILEGVPPITDKLMLRKKNGTGASSAFETTNTATHKQTSPALSEDKVLGVVETNSFKQSNSNKKDLI